MTRGSYKNPNGAGYEDKVRPPVPVLPKPWHERDIIEAEGQPQCFAKKRSSLYERRPVSWSRPQGLPPGRITGPVRTFQKLLAGWGLDQQDAAILLGADPSNSHYVESILCGRITLRHRDEKDRIVYLLRLKALLTSLFRDEQFENEWLRQRHAGLGGRSPLELLREGSMRNLMRVVDYVETLGGM
jgi:hypothetical protein